MHVDVTATGIYKNPQHKACFAKFLKGRGHLSTANSFK